MKPTSHVLLTVRLVKAHTLVIVGMVAHESDEIMRVGPVAVRQDVASEPKREGEGFASFAERLGGTGKNGWRDLRKTIERVGLAGIAHGGLSGLVDWGRVKEHACIWWTWWTWWTFWTTWP
jgi:hypothetical protein